MNGAKSSSAETASFPNSNMNTARDGSQPVEGSRLCQTGFFLSSRPHSVSF